MLSERLLKRFTGGAGGFQLLGLIFIIPPPLYEMSIFPNTATWSKRSNWPTTG